VMMKLRASRPSSSRPVGSIEHDILIVGTSVSFSFLFVLRLNVIIKTKTLCDYF
jgi:hypothetical protein